MNDDDQPQPSDDDRTDHDRAMERREFDAQREHFERNRKLYESGTW